MSRTKTLIFTLQLLLICLAFRSVAQADPITFTVTNPNLTGAPGSAVSLVGSISNPLTMPVTLILSPPFPLPVDPGDIDIENLFSGFSFGDTLLSFAVNNDPANGFTIAPGQSAVGTLLTFMLGPNANPGLYKLKLTVLEMVPGAFPPRFVFSEVGLTLNVTTAPVPEPATILLLGTGLTGVWLRARSKRKCS